MSRIGLVVAALIGLVSSISTASAAPFEFAGFYAGGHAGYAESSADFDSAGGGGIQEGILLQSLVFFGGSGSNLTGGGSMGGLQAGFNFVDGNLLWGVETDISLTNADPHGACPNNPGVSCDVSTGPMATLRGRFGYAVDDWLLYVSGGVAGSKFELETNGLGGSNGGMFGWTVGAGVEYLIGDIVGLKLEYRYLQFGDFGGFDKKLQDPTGADIDVNMHVIMGGINFHF